MKARQTQEEFVYIHLQLFKLKTLDFNAGPSFTTFTTITMRSMPILSLCQVSKPQCSMKYAYVAMAIMATASSI